MKTGRGEDLRPVFLPVTNETHKHKICAMLIPTEKQLFHPTSAHAPACVRANIGTPGRRGTRYAGGTAEKIHGKDA